MARLIDAEKLIEAFEPEYHVDWYTPWIIDEINKQPTVDAVEVVHGEWEELPNSFRNGYKCSCCGQTIKVNFWSNRSRSCSYIWATTCA